MFTKYFTAVTFKIKLTYSKGTLSELKKYGVKSCEENNRDNYSVKDWKRKGWRKRTGKREKGGPESVKLECREKNSKEETNSKNSTDLIFILFDLNLLFMLKLKAQKKGEK